MAAIACTLLALTLAGQAGPATQPTGAATTASADQPASAPTPTVMNSGAQIWLAQAAAAYDEMRLEDARAALDRAMRDPSNTRSHLVEIYRLQGLVEASIGQPIAAKRAFAEMLVLAPDAKLADDLSPKIQSAFDSARASLPGERGVLVESAAPAEVLMAREAELPIRLNDTLGLVEQIEVSYRVAGGPPTTVTLTRQDHGVLKVPASALPTQSEPYGIELAATAQNAYGAPLAQLVAGTAGSYVRVVAELTREETPWYQQWWVWASVAGGVAAAAAVTGGLVWWLAPPDRSPRDVSVVVQ
jgi:hypothetical protein